MTKDTIFRYASGTETTYPHSVTFFAPHLLRNATLQKAAFKNICEKHGAVVDGPWQRTP